MTKKFVFVLIASIATALFVVGCGGASGGSGNSIKAVDGYILNADVKALYWDKKTQKVKAYNKLSFESAMATVDGKEKGAPDYSIPDGLPKEVKDNMVGYVLSAKKYPGTNPEGVPYAPSFFDSDLDGVYKATADVALSKEKLYSLNGYGIISPVTTLAGAKVFHQINTDQNLSSNANLTAKDLQAFVKVKGEEIAEKLGDAFGITGGDIMSLDPVSEGGKYYLVNGMLAAAIPDDIGGASGDDFTNILDLTTKVDDLVKIDPGTANGPEIFESLDTAFPGKSFQQVANYLKTNTVDPKKMNIDKTRIKFVSSGGTFEPEVLEVSEGIFDVASNGITVDGKSTGTLISEGDKIGKDSTKGTVKLLIDTTELEANISAQKFSIAGSLSNGRDSVAGAGNRYSILFRLNNLELNYTKADGLKVRLPEVDEAFEYEVLNAADGQSISGDTNGTGQISTLVSIVNKNEITIELWKLFTEANNTAGADSFKGGRDDWAGQIADLKLLLVEPEEEEIFVKKSLWPTDSIYAAVNPNLNSQGKVLLDLRVDSRGILTARNQLPVIALDGTELNLTSGGAHSNISKHDNQTVWGEFGVVNANPNTNEVNDEFQVYVLGNVSNLITLVGNEQNQTVEPDVELPSGQNVTVLSGKFATGTTVTPETIKVQFDVAKLFEYRKGQNLTGKAVPLKFVIKDEFGAKNTQELNISFKHVNRLPILHSSIELNADQELTKNIEADIALDAGGNITAMIPLFTDPDNATAVLPTQINKLQLAFNSSFAENQGNLTENIVSATATNHQVNVSIPMASYNIAHANITLTADGNLSFLFRPTAKHTNLSSFADNLTKLFSDGGNISYGLKLTGNTVTPKRYIKKLKINFTPAP